jgi:hypothetical protein
MIAARRDHGEKGELRKKEIAADWRVSVCSKISQIDHVVGCAFLQSFQHLGAPAPALRAKRIRNQPLQVPSQLAQFVH